LRRVLKDKFQREFSKSPPRPPTSLSASWILLCWEILTNCRWPQSQSLASACSACSYLLPPFLQLLSLVLRSMPPPLVPPLSSGRCSSPIAQGLRDRETSPRRGIPPAEVSPGMPPGEEDAGFIMGENASKAFSHLQQMKMPRSPMLGPVLLGLLLIARCPNLLPSTSIQPLPISLKSWR